MAFKLVVFYFLLLHLPMSQSKPLLAGTVYYVNDNALTASSVYSNEYEKRGPRCGLIRPSKAPNCLRIGWLKHQSAVVASGWIQADLGEIFLLFWVMSKTDESSVGSMKSFYIYFSEHHPTVVHGYIDENDETPTIFNSNDATDRRGGGAFTPPIRARYVRLKLKTCDSACNTAWEVHGEKVTAETFQSIETLMSGPVSNVPNSAMTSSSVFSEYHTAKCGFLIYRGVIGCSGRAWNQAQENSWIMVEFNGIRHIQFIATRPRADNVDQYMETYTIAYGISESLLESYMADGDSEATLFAAHDNPHDVVVNMLTPYITAKLVQLITGTCHNHCQMSWELYGKVEPTEYQLGSVVNMVHSEATRTTSVFPYPVPDRVTLPECLLLCAGFTYCQAVNYSADGHVCELTEGGEWRDNLVLTAGYDIHQLIGR